MDKNNFPRGIEVVTSAIIRRKNGEILLVSSPKWPDKWTLPGGHIEPGETIVEAAWREAKEETGLELKPVQIVHSGELINPKEFHRPAHFIYFDVAFDALNEAVNLDPRELSGYQWIEPEEALMLGLAEGYAEVIKKYIAFRVDKE